MVPILVGIFVPADGQSKGGIETQITVFLSDLFGLCSLIG